MSSYAMYSPLYSLVLPPLNLVATHSHSLFTLVYSNITIYYSLTPLPILLVYSSTVLLTLFHCLFTLKEARIPRSL